MVASIRLNRCKLKVIIEKSQGASTFVRGGWQRVLEACGHQCFEYWPEQHAVFDVFNRAESDGKPVDLFLGTTYNCNNAVEKIIRLRPNMKVGMFCSTFGPILHEIDLKEYPIHTVSEEEKDRLSKLKRETDKPNIVYVHTTDRCLEKMCSWWGSIGIKYMGLLNGADVFTYLGAKPEDRYKCDVSFVGGRWAYKAKTLDKYIGRLSNDRLVNEGTISLRVYGGGWEIPQYLGGLNFGEDAKVFASSLICPNISEGHSYIVDDIIERVFKVPCAGGFLISDQVNLEEIGLKDCTPQFSTYEQFIHLIEKYTKEEYLKERDEISANQQSTVLSLHTYHDRMAKLFNKLGFTKEAEEILDNKKQILNRYFDNREIFRG